MPVITYAAKRALIEKLSVIANEIGGISLHSCTVFLQEYEELYVDADRNDFGKACARRRAQVNNNCEDAAKL